jgi:CHAT domain-containing protein
MADAAAAAAGTRGIKKRGIQRRNLSIVQAAAPKPEVEPEMAPPINFKLLPQLPDTSLEIQEVGGVLSADKGRDIFLFERASESLVKQTDLSPYRVVMFATHGLMNGEMPGLYQPALALTNPTVTGEKEDGMLTMEEILGLKLKADWVVLSACNSAAAGGAVERIGVRPGPRVFLRRGEVPAGDELGGGNGIGPNANDGGFQGAGEGPRLATGAGTTAVQS